MTCSSVVQGYGGAAAQAACRSTLPFTGLNLTGVAFVALVIVAAGVVLWWAQRERRRTLDAE